MPSNFKQFIIAAAVALATVASVSVIDSAGAGLPAAQAELITQEPLTNRDVFPVSETDFRLGDHQQLRKLFLGN
jgi:hypothetical protein